LVTFCDESTRQGILVVANHTTCKNLGIDPQAYLRDVLDRISTHPARRIDELPPDRWQELRQANDIATD
jgi:hypothetical protein